MHNLDCKMSDNSESGSESSVKFGKQNGNDDDICRDYLRNVCKRGKRCKYRHPHSEESTRERKYDYTFCHDFQNTGCHRPNCKFLHCSREEEEHYKQTGQLPVRLQQAAALGVGVTPSNDMPLLKGEIPICKDYLKMNCKRGIKCKFRHLTATEYEFELRKSDQRNNNSQSYDPYEEDFERFESFEYCHGSSGVKRRRTERDIDGFGSNYVENRYSPSRPLSYQLLEDENSVLRRKVDELKKQVADLTATNEVLLEQNARYRVSRTSLGTSHVAAPQSLNHLANSLAQQIALNSELASQHALQQRLARELAPVSAAAQGSLNQPTVTMNPGSIVPVSLPQNNLTGVTLAPVSIQQTLPPPVSMTQALPPPVSLTQSLPQNMQAATTTLVSYPIVSQNLRTVSSLSH